jgi:hypothetical protein
MTGFRYMQLFPQDAMHLVALNLKQDIPILANFSIQHVYFLHYEFPCPRLIDLIYHYNPTIQSQVDNYLLPILQYDVHVNSNMEILHRLLEEGATSRVHVRSGVAWSPTALLYEFEFFKEKHKIKMYLLFYLQETSFMDAIIGPYLPWWNNVEIEPIFAIMSKRLTRLEQALIH